MRSWVVLVLLFSLFGCDDDVSSVDLGQDARAGSLDADLEAHDAADFPPDAIVDPELDAGLDTEVAPTPDSTAPDDASLDDALSLDAAPLLDAELIDAQRPDAAAPECANDADCSTGWRCVQEICRLPCIGSCVIDITGEICHEGACVECVSDRDCLGRERCDEHMICEPRQDIDPTITQIGMFYFLWHCPASAINPPHDISEVLAGRQNWGPYGEFHYWSRPEAGYYCLSQNDGLLRTHAEQLRDAGMDFVFIDVTNHAYVDGRSDRTGPMILAPFDRMLAVWSQVPDAPKIVPWVPVVEPNTNPAVNTVDALLERLARYPGMQFEYLGRPLLLATVNSVHNTNQAKLAQLRQNYTVREMWGVYHEDGPSWSFLQWCEDGPRAGRPCNQRLGVLDGEVEQISITTAYQAGYMNAADATGKLGGLTFRKQFETLFDYPEVPIATITGWNEWIAQRQRCGHALCPCDQYPDGCFIDTWDADRNRDIEPSAGAPGDLYYRLLQSCVSLFRRGERCDASNAAQLCCHGI